jgi:hypothetical protein
MSVPPRPLPACSRISALWSAFRAVIEPVVPHVASCLALHRRASQLLWPRLTAASPSSRLTTSVASRQRCSSPRVRRVTVAPSTRRIYARPVRMTSGFRVLCPLAPSRAPRMRFVCLGPELCLRLPSHDTSRCRSCRSARGSGHHGPQRTSTSTALPASLSLAVAQRHPRRFAPCLAHKAKGPVPRGGPGLLDCVCDLRPWLTAPWSSAARTAAHPEGSDNNTSRTCGARS